MKHKIEIEIIENWKIIKYLVFIKFKKIKYLVFFRKNIILELCMIIILLDITADIFNFIIYLFIKLLFWFFFYYYYSKIIMIILQQ